MERGYCVIETFSLLILGGFEKPKVLKLEFLKESQAD